jgi:hypothetical protein
VTGDPFELLGLPPDASAAEIRAARRRLAKDRHPDAGGDEQRMRELNAAAAAALRRRSRSEPPPDAGDEEADVSAAASRTGPPRHVRRVADDVPSFTVEALPAEAFEGLLVAGTVLGEVLDDDPPYRLDVLLAAPLDCWCRLDVLPEAGASSVSITIGALDDRPPATVEAVRDAWVATLNELDWPGPS